MEISTTLYRSFSYYSNVLLLGVDIESYHSNTVVTVLETEE